MIRMLVFFAALAGIAFGFAQLMETPGHVMLTYGGFEYRLTLAKALVALLVLVTVLMAVWTLLRLALRLPSLISMSNRMRRRSRGYTAVSRGMVSLGIGDRRSATRFAGEAERLLGREPLTLLLKAQAAQLSGDRQVAEKAFARMLDHSDTKVLGLRGLYIEARRNGAAEARTFAEEAFRLAPAAPWAGEAILEYRSAEKDWRGAIAVVDEAASRRSIDRATAKRQKSALLTAAALDQLERTPDEAFRLGSEALKLNPAQVPAAILVARRLSAKGDYGKASKVIEAAWKQIPHPELAEAYLDVRHGDSSHDRLKRARHLAKLAPGSRESRMLVARAALDAREFTLARQELDSLVLDQPTARVCRLMADLEERDSGNAGIVRKWLSRASIAPRDPAWVADGFVAENWAPVSPVTGRIDAFEWITPPQSIESQVRASIDADRMSPPPPVEEPVVLEAMPPSPAPAPVAADLAAEPVAAEVVPPAAPKVEEPTGILTHLPDDPGPRLPEAKPRKGWKLFD